MWRLCLAMPSPISEIAAQSAAACGSTTRLTKRRARPTLAQVTSRRRRGRRTRTETLERMTACPRARCQWTDPIPRRMSTCRPRSCLSLPVCDTMATTRSRNNAGTNRLIKTIAVENVGTKARPPQGGTTISVVMAVTVIAIATGALATVLGTRASEGRAPVAPRGWSGTACSSAAWSLAACPNPIFGSTSTIMARSSRSA
mmetsp:Transcript_100830/g.291562  ORF Transcript_100830/g.291562 Transcript_100830/m.291562 type:complete len:201 (+) Transcript_100830:213-815(+)